MQTNELALKIRRHVLEMTHNAQSSHVGSCLSIADILAVLYGEIMQDGDKFILSKGHAVAALYATLAECGVIDNLDSFYQNGSLLIGHASHYVPGIEVSTGSLGQGLSIGCGMALSMKKNVYVLLGEGDCNEGQTWEAVMFANQHRLSNLIAIVDYNGFQGMGQNLAILDLEPFAKKWQSFGWFTFEIDGHSHKELSNAFECLTAQPKCIIAHTIKGKGVSILENRVESHYKYLNGEELVKALMELK